MYHSLEASTVIGGKWSFLLASTPAQSYRLYHKRQARIASTQAKLAPNVVSYFIIPYRVISDAFWALLATKLPTSASADPNNAPKGEESVSLRITATQMQVFIDQRAEEATGAAEVYNAIMNQHNEQSHAPEKLGSEVFAKNLADSLEELCLATSPEMQELQELFHPIRLCPDDILQMIFEECVIGGTVMFTGAIRLSHVCKRWRNLALSTAGIWRQIAFKLKTSSTFQWSQVEAFVHRVKSSPADITITVSRDDVCTHDAMIITEKIFDVLICRVPVLSMLRLLLTMDDASSILNSIRSFPKGRLDYVSIAAISIMRGSVEIGTFLSKFVSFRSLKVLKGDFGGSISPNLAMVLTNTQEIDMYGVMKLPALEMLKTTPEVRVLRMERCGIWSYGTITADKCVLPHLHTLTTGTVAFPWGQIQCPNLTKLTFNSVPEDDDNLWEFLSSNLGIADITLDECDPGQFVKFARTLPQLKRLRFGLINVKETLKVLTSWHDFGLETPPFPCLLHLNISCMHAAYGVGVEALDDIIRGRCLPREHPESTMDPQVISSIQKFEVTVEDADMKWDVHHA